MVTPPSGLLFSVQAARDWIDMGAGSGGNVKIEGLIRRSETEAENYLQRALRLQTRRAVVRVLRGRAMLEPWNAMQSVEASTGYYGISTTWYTVNFADPNVIGLPDTGVVEWSPEYYNLAGNEWLRLTYTAGWETVPVTIVDACRDYVAWSWNDGKKMPFSWDSISTYRWL